MLENLTDGQLKEYKALFAIGNAKSHRFESRKCNNQDNKFLYHIVRLLDECDQILSNGNIDLHRSKEVMKSIRRGEWTLEQVREWMKKKDSTLETLYQKSELPYSAPEDKLKELLLNCLEHHYGSLDGAYSEQDSLINAMKEIDLVLEKHRNSLYK